MTAAWTFVGRFGLVILGMLGALLLLEGALQAARLVASAAGARDETAILGEQMRVLSLGDSNTYGLYVEHAEAYPQLLERLWNEDPQRRPIQVINLGFPGTNSSTVRKNLPGLLNRVRPDLVTVLIGTNDFWTVPVRDWETQERGFNLRDWAWKFSRLYRLYYIRFAEYETPELGGSYSLSNPLPFDSRHAKVKQGGEEFEFGFDTATGGRIEDWPGILVENLDAIVAMTADWGADLVLLTYLSEDPPYSHTNAVIREFARRRGVRLIDPGRRLRPRCRKGKCAELLPDQHPSAIGYEFVANILLRELKDRQ